jgi:hypothetical protein
LTKPPNQVLCRPGPRSEATFALETLLLSWFVSGIALKIWACFSAEAFLRRGTIPCWAFPSPTPKENAIMSSNNPSLFLLFVLVLLLIPSAAAAQNQCVPFGGTIYAWHTNAWIGSGEFTVGRQVLHATINDVNTSIVKDGDVWRGTETATFDFGSENTVDLMTDFVTEHMNDAAAASGVFHVNEIGTFAHGTGIFKNAYGHFSSQGPFGPKVKLPENVKPPENADMFWIGQYNGMICGIAPPKK